MKKILLIAVTACLSITGCKSTTLANSKAISIEYDPFIYKPATIGAEAQAHCETYGKDAVQDGGNNTVAGVEKHFRCE